MRPSRAGRAVLGVVVVAAVTGATWRAATSGGPDRRAASAPHAARTSERRSRPSSQQSTPLDRLTARWVVAENAKPGTKDWIISETGPPHAIEGFADQVSAQQGDTVTLYVSTTAPSFRVEAYRTGYYQGLGGRLVWASGPLNGVQQPKPTLAPGTNMVEARWQPSLRVPIDSTWPPGDYLLKLVASTGPQRYVPLTIRDDTSTAAFVIQNSVATWQAYNVWGDYDLYQGGPHGAFAQRSRIVSFDRPYARDGSADFLGNELPLVWFIESKGLDVTYWTDIDLARRPELLLRHRALLTLGHDEYWSTSMRRGAEAARDQGVNLVFFGSNAVFRHIRLAASPLGPGRRIVDYKSATEDPLARSDPEEVTVNWRDPPLREPESTLIGQEYECNPVNDDMVVFDASAWVFAGTGLRPGDRLPGLIGTEYDRYDPRQPGPQDVQVLAHSPVVCHGRASHSDMTYYTAPSGAGVLSTGTGYWINNLTGPCFAGTCRHSDAVVQITWNVLRAFGAGPAGRTAPSTPNAGLLPRATTGPRPPGGE